MASSRSIPPVEFDKLHQVVPSPVRSFKELGGLYLYVIHPPGITFSLDHVRRERDGLHGELAVRVDLPGARVTTTGGLFTADFNLSSARARTERGRILADRSKNSELDWQGYLEEFCERVFEHERTGDPVQYIHQAGIREADAVIDCCGIPILRHHPMIMFGDGGSGKSYLGLYFMGLLRLAGEKVLYLDWEFDIEEHRDRLHRLFGADMPHIAYLRCHLPLHEEITRVQRVIRDEGITYCLMDSIGFACPQPEASDAALRYLAATRSLKVGSLHLAHVSKAENGDQKPFGSAFWHNGARATWFVQAAEDLTEGQPLQIGLYHRKANTGRRLGARGFALYFERDHTVIERADVGDTPGLAKKQSIVQQMANNLRRGPMTADDLADVMEENKESITRKARAYKDRFTTHLDANGRRLIALVARDR